MKVGMQDIYHNQGAIMEKVKLGKKLVGEGEPCFIAFECGATFENIDQAKKLVKAAAEAGADGIKFQVLDADRLMGDKSLTINYTTAAGSRTGNLYDILKKRVLKKEEWKEIKDYCDSLGITFFSTACFPEEVDFLVEIGSAAIKINAGDVNHYYLIDYASKKGMTIILDGRAKYDELEQGVRICEKNGNENIIIMHCPSGYPARNDGVNLSVLGALKKIYRYPIGFSDHSREKLMNYPAVVMGADLLEKTLTLDKNADAIEHLMSLEPEEAKTFVSDIRALEEAVGSPRIMFSKKVNEASRRSIVAAADISEGEAITLEKIDFMRPGNAGISCDEYEIVCSRKAAKDIKSGEFIAKDMLSD
jgi:sialic acid synthase SpsE